MEVSEKIRSMKKDKRMMTAVVVLGLAGLILIMLSSVFSGGSKKKAAESIPELSTVSSGEYCEDTQQRLEAFLSQVDGAGRVRVFLKVSSEQRYVYATEGKQSRSENRAEEEEKYVLIGGSSGRSALIETIQAPEIEGAVILCSGGSIPVVQERIYRAASAALGIPTARIYVAALNGKGE
ncbi:MAG: hypothetical protein IKO47_11100 [Ruminococcus sp.]|nr:hypothetical protein [Ruminococcus sp.]